MKITLANGTVLEMDDAPATKPEAKDATAPATTTASTTSKQADAVTAKPPAVKPEPKAAQPTREAVPPARSAQTQPPASEEQPAQPVSNSLHSFALQGGVNDILDPGRGNPNVYQFVQPKGDA